VVTNWGKETEVQLEGDVRTDMGKMKTQNWSEMALDREEWKRTVEQVKTHKELWLQGKKTFRNAESLHGKYRT
jgi:hypothetical protein